MIRERDVSGRCPACRCWSCCSWSGAASVYGLVDGVREWSPPPRSWSGAWRCC